MLPDPQRLIDYEHRIVIPHIVAQITGLIVEELNISLQIGLDSKLSQVLNKGSHRHVKPVCLLSPEGRLKALHLMSRLLLNLLKTLFYIAL